MTPAQVADVQQSFAQLRPQADTVAARFYQRLFTLDPSVRPLFPNDLTAQGRKLMDMLGLVVHGLPRVDTILPAVQALGRRHVQYGVQPEHYKTVGAALLWTLEQELGAAWTPEVREAWTGVSAYPLYGFGRISLQSHRKASVGASGTLVAAIGPFDRAASATRSA